MAVKQVQERASEQQQERQILESVGPVLRQQKKARDQHEAPEDPAARAAAVILVEARALRDLQLRIRPESQPNTAPSPNAQIVMPTSA